MSQERDHWIFSVSRANWDTVQKKNLWGLRQKDSEWSKRIKKGDILIFAVTGTSPVILSGAYRVAGEWFTDTEKLWPDEIERNETLYPIRVNIEPVQIGSAQFDILVPRLNFVRKKERKSRYTYLRGTPANLRRPIPLEDYETILGELRNSPGPPELPVPPSRHPKSATGPDHDGVRNMIREIGEMEGRVSEVEYQMDGWRLDVAWKRIATGIPSHAFEVQIGGNFYEALAKLKHAYDKWNSKPVLVTTEKYEKEAHTLLSGSFHEIRHVISIVNWQVIVEFYRLQRRTWKLREEIGLR